jgi:hypothetical protein
MSAVAGGLPNSSGTQPSQDRQDPAVMIFGLGQPELCEDVTDVALNRLRADLEAGSDALIGLSLSHEGENLALPIGQLSRRAVIPLAREQPSNDGGIDDAFALADTLQGIKQDVDV